MLWAQKLLKQELPFMSRFRIEPHGGLQEWVADEKGYFNDEGLDYEFLTSYATQASGYALVQSTETAAPEVKRGAFENMERGRAADISCACHWAVNMASSSALEKVLKPDEIKLGYIDQPQHRLAALLDRRVDASNLFGAPLYLAEQQGCRRILDTTFMIGFLLHPDIDDVKRYFRALQRAQGDIDLEPERVTNITSSKNCPENITT
jgi:hypothetical protein